MTGCYADGGHDGQVDDGVCANCGQEVTAPAGRSSTPTEGGGVSVVRPRKGDLEVATTPHPFRPSGEYVGLGQNRERCDLCGLVQRGPGTHHNEQETP